MYFSEGYDTGNEADVELSIHEDIIHTSDDLKDHGQYVPSRAEIMEERSAERKRRNKKPDKLAAEEKKSRLLKIYLSIIVLVDEFNGELLLTINALLDL